MVSLNRVIILFFIYSFIGWLWETIYCSLKAKKFVYRGFLLGPYCPIYGFGILSVLFFVEPYQNNLLLLYVFSAIMVTILEYVTSYLLEKIFKATWWDYHQVPLNINGRVAVPISLFWGIGCVLIVKVVAPKIEVLSESLLSHFGNSLPLIISLVMFSDLVYTVINMTAFQKLLGSWTGAVVEAKAKLQQRGSQTSEWLTELKTNSPVWSKLPHPNFNHRRMFNSFKGFKTTGETSIEELKVILDALKNKKS